jgi:hypothetical protein
MNSAEREQFKDSLRGVIAGRHDGIDLDTPFHWIVEGIKQPEPFFACLGSLLPADAILYFEGISIASDIAKFYAAHRAANAVAVIRDTIFPVPDVYHVAGSAAVIDRLREWAASRPIPDLFDHVKAYRGESLLFTFHDAFDGWLLISDHASEPVVAEFCRNLGVTYRREQTRKRDPEQLRRFLWALENPDRVRIAGEPWWRRVWRRWKPK